MNTISPHDPNKPFVFKATKRRRIVQKQKSNCFRQIACVFGEMALCLCMIKNKDVVVDRQGRIFQVVDTDFRNDRLGRQILCRLYRSQKRFAFMPWQVKKHPFFS
jgi:hypothetical protein